MAGRHAGRSSHLTFWEPCTSCPRITVKLWRYAGHARQLRRTVTAQRPRRAKRIIALLPAAAVMKRSLLLYSLATGRVGGVLSALHLPWLFQRRIRSNNSDTKYCSKTHHQSRSALPCFPKFTFLLLPGRGCLALERGRQPHAAQKTIHPSF